MWHKSLLGAGALVACALALPVQAQTYPDKPIKITQGFAAGGNADTIARLVGSEMSKTLGQPVIVEAHTGAGGTIASGAVARAQPDGYNLLLATGGHAVAGAIYKNPGYRAADDYQMISTITYFPFLIAVREDSPYRTLSELLEVARKDPGAISYGTAGIGTTHHLAVELLAKMAKVDMLHVPYRGDAASVTALLGGEIPFIIAPPTAVMPNIQGGKLRALAATGPQRWSAMPELPTVAEQGVPGYGVTSWAGLMAPAGTPRPVIDTLNAAVLKALEVPAVRERLVAMGGEVEGSTPEDMAAMVAGELKKWTAVVHDSNIPQQ
ncbi:MAG: tripartite tricarboxylate transporter substrate binding protein [Pigmentiphaga sp.]|nr:tripartite tricarboxylate transporter substrate binding protein [Pigmentiphaga sp.]